MPLLNRKWLSEVDVLLYILVVVFNMVSYIDTSAIVVELPLLINRLPEGWSLPSKLVVIAQTSKVSILSYSILKYFFKNRLKEMPFVYFVIIADVIGVLGIAFWWNKTTNVNNTEHSIALMVFTGLLAFADGLCNVVFLPYLGRYKTQYTSAFFLGGGLCQVVPVIIGMGQGVGERPLCLNETLMMYSDTSGLNYTVNRVTATFPSPIFSIRLFFLIILGWIFVSGISFSLLHFLPYFKKKQTRNNMHVQMDMTSEVKDLPIKDAQHNEFTLEDIATKNVTSIQKQPNTNQMGRGEVAFCLISLAIADGMCSGFFLSIQSYACLPYGNRAYLLALRLCRAMNPAVSFMSLFIYTKSNWRITLLNLGGMAFAIYTLFLALESPFPPMKGTVIGEVLAILTSCGTKAFFMYGRSCLVYKMRDGGGHHGLMFSGLSMSLGGAISAALSFLLVNYFKLFKKEPPCPGM